MTEPEKSMLPFFSQADVKLTDILFFNAEALRCAKYRRESRRSAVL